MDRRSRQYSVQIPQRQAAARLDILVEAMGHVNFGPEIHDRKGLHAPVTLKSLDGVATEPGPGRYISCLWMSPCSRA